MIVVDNIAVSFSRVFRWMTSDDSSPIDVYAAAKRMTMRAAARVLFGIDLQQRQRTSSPSNSCYGCVTSDDGFDMAQDLDDFGAGFFTLPIPIPGTAFYKVRFLGWYL